MMNTLLSLTTGFILFLSATQAQASGSRVGSGGQGVVCAQGASPKLLDLYEAIEFYGREVFSDLFDTKTEFEHVTDFTLRLRDILGKQHPFLSVLQETILLRSSMALSDGPLRVTTDGGFVLGLKNGCQVVQVAARGEGLLNGKLEVLRSYWEGASEKEKALLLIHEALHSWFDREVPEGDFSDTLAIRQLVGLLYTDSFQYPMTYLKIRELVATRQALADAELTSEALRP